MDRDEDINAQVEYSIYEKESPGVKDLFGVNRQTGGIYLLKSAVPYGNKYLIYCLNFAQYFFSFYMDSSCYY